VKVNFSCDWLLSVSEDLIWWHINFVAVSAGASSRHVSFFFMFESHYSSFSRLYSSVISIYWWHLNVSLPIQNLFYFSRVPGPVFTSVLRISLKNAISTDLHWIVSQKELNNVNINSYAAHEVHYLLNDLNDCKRNKWAIAASKLPQIRNYTLLQKTGNSRSWERFLSQFYI